MGIPRVSAWVTGDTPTGATPQVQLGDTPMRVTPHAQPRPAQPSWMDWPDSTYPAGAIPTYPSYGTFTTLSATYVQSQNCQPDVGTWAFAAAGQSMDTMSVSTIAPVTLKGRHKTLQMLIGEITNKHGSYSSANKIFAVLRRTAQTRSAALWGVSGSYGQAPAQQGMSGLVRETSHLWVYSSPSPSLQLILREPATSILCIHLNVSCG